MANRECPACEGTGFLWIWPCGDCKRGETTLQDHGSYDETDLTQVQNKISVSENEAGFGVPSREVENE